MSPVFEEWRPVPGFHGFYEVSDQGRVRGVDRYVSGRHGLRFHRGVALKPSWSGKYYFVNLGANGLKTPRNVHALVLAAFAGPRPPGMHGCHNDGNVANNHLSNLRYDTPKGNAADMHVHGTRVKGERVCTAVLTEQEVRIIRRARASGETYPAIADWFGVTKSTIWSICTGRSWKHVA